MITFHIDKYLKWKKVCILAKKVNAKGKFEIKANFCMPGKAIFLNALIQTVEIEMFFFYEMFIFLRNIRALKKFYS